MPALARILHHPALPLGLGLAVAGAGGLLLLSGQAPAGLMVGQKGLLGEWSLGAGQPGPWLLAVGLLLVALTTLRLLAPARRFPHVPLLALAGVLLVAVTSVATQACEGKVGEAFGQRVWWLDDDMMVSLRYARNLATGEGLVWNSGEKVEGITNFLWTLVMAVPHTFLVPTRVSLAVIVLNGALLLALLGAVFRLLRALGASTPGAFFAGLALATWLPLIHWTAAGGEVILLALLLVLLAQEMVATGEGRFRPLRLGVLAGLAVLTRPDALIAAGVLLAAAVLLREPRSEEHSSRRSWWLAPVVFLAFPLALTLFRWLYYGNALPNTYYLKATGWDTRTWAGLDYLARLLGQHALVLGLAFSSVLVTRRERTAPLLAALLAHLVYLVHVGGDELPEQRFLVPVAPFLFGLAFLSVDRLAQRMAPDGAAAVVLPAVLLALTGFGSALLPGQFPLRAERRAESERANVEIGLLLRENTTEDARIAHFWAGAAPYFSMRPGIDLLGKCDPTVAHGRAKDNLLRPGHNKYDFDHSLGLNPDVVVGGIASGDFRDPAFRNLIEGMKKGPYRAFAVLYEHSRFRQSFERVTAPADLPRLQQLFLWHGVWTRRDTDKAVPPQLWKIPLTP